eukprot:TRINITY_DN3379_c0_g5_i3.p1 TRINITY_DN3379_c0_g5~~TRINITY_DN3379_c0_g5_i3.p1  ORF type:complete len:260 (-),score=51.42 TRINITY_DN3379_c0_g5_i3:91-870(-)
MTQETEDFQNYGIGTLPALLPIGSKAEPESSSALDCIPSLRGKEERQGFVRKVYSLVFMMLLVPTALVVICVYVDPVREFVIKYRWIYYVTSGLTIGMLLSLICFYHILKSVPANYIFLFSFTVFESYSVASLTCHYEPKSILYAAILTAVMGLSLSLFACFTSADLSGIGHALCWVSLGVSLAAMILMLIVRSHWILLVCSWVFLILAGLYLIVDTQLIIGGRHKELTVDDYIIAALMLFIDFVTIFVHLLAIIGQRR